MSKSKRNGFDQLRRFAVQAQSDHWFATRLRNRLQAFGVAVDRLHTLREMALYVGIPRDRLNAGDVKYDEIEEAAITWAGRQHLPAMLVRADDPKPDWSAVMQKSKIADKLGISEKTLNEAVKTGRYRLNKLSRQQYQIDLNGVDVASFRRFDRNSPD
jgi:hypothetical protein